MFFLVPAYPGCPGAKAVKWLCCVCVCVCVLLVRIECKKSIDEECICCALEHLSNIMEFNFQQGHSLSISSLMNDV